MPFCGFCGTEVAPGQKFCGQCGAPVSLPPSPPPADQPAPPPPPPPPPVPPLGAVPEAPGTAAALPATPGGKPSNRNAIIAGVAIIVLVILAAAVWSSGALPVGKTAAPAQTTVKTTIPATARSTSIATTVPTTATPTPVPTPVTLSDDRYEETYELVYSTSEAFTFGEKKSFPYTLNNPPLYVKFEVTPGMVNRTKIVNIGTSTEQTVYTSYEDPNAWFEVRVLSADGSSVIENRGFGVSKGYSIVPKQEFMVRTGGEYLIEISGSQVTADVRVLIGTS